MRGCSCRWRSEPSPQPYRPIDTAYGEAHDAPVASRNVTLRRVMDLMRARDRIVRLDDKLREINEKMDFLDGKIDELSTLAACCAECAPSLQREAEARKSGGLPPAVVPRVPRSLKLAAWSPTLWLALPALLT